MSTKSSGAYCLALRSFIGNDRGATAIEYAMIASGIAGAIISVVYSLGSQVKTTLWDRIELMFP